MTFVQINYFLAIVKFQSFTRAAAALFVTQSTLSRSIAALEDELGVKLLERDFRSIRLTPAGEFMSKEMQVIMANINTVINRVQELGDERNNRFSVGVLDGQSIDCDLMQVIRVLYDRFPNLTIGIQRTYYNELLENIRTGQFDIAEIILESDAVLPKDIESMLLAELDNYLVIQQDDSLCETEPDLSVLRERTLIASAIFQPGLDKIKCSLLEKGIEAEIKFAPDVETQAMWLESGKGVYIANEENVIFTSRTFRPLRAFPIPELPKNRKVLIWNRNNRSGVLEDFLSFLRQAHDKK